MYKEIENFSSWKKSDIECEDCKENGKTYQRMWYNRKTKQSFRKNKCRVCNKEWFTSHKKKGKVENESICY